MSYFAPYLDDTGFHLPTYEDRLEDLCDNYRQIFGQDAELLESIPDYQLLSVFAKALDDASALLLQVYNSRNPAYAQGQQLDLLLPQYGITRRGATKSTVTLTLTASSRITVAKGTKFGDTSGRLWSTSAAVYIGNSGTATVAASCDTPGPIFAAAGTVTVMVRAISGLISVTNRAGSSIGLNAETDAEVRAKIAAAMAGKGTTTWEALEAGLKQIDNVRMVHVAVNDTGTTDDRGIPPHAIACVVLGGNQTSIAQTIWGLKAPGIPTHGSTLVMFTDEIGSHTVGFSRPVSKLTYFNVALKRLEGFDEEAVEVAISEVITEAAAEVPIGGSLNLPQLFGRCYAAAGSLAGTFVLKSIEASAAESSESSAQTTTEVLSLTWRERVVIPTANGIQFVLT